ncbi:MAG: DNA polymerase III subunit alpha, partial [Lentisphaeria bacterium]|nr:DNA polymerase III subunit alpha [Lentisphaeria bacterium]
MDGAQSVSSIIKQAKAFGMPAVALTDHGSMSGVYALTQACETMQHDKNDPYDLNGIVGCEFYVAPGSRLDHSMGEANWERCHLVVLAENNTGYVNMCHMSEEAWLRGYYYKPRIDFETLAKYKEGVIVLSACLSGQIPRLLLQGREKEAFETARKYRDLLGEKNYFIELQDHGLEEQKQTNPLLIDIANKLGLGLVVTNDAHYLRQEAAEAQDLMVCIGTQTTINDPKRMKFGTNEFYFKSSEEMALLFPQLPEAMSNTVDIANRCHVHLKTVDGDGANHYPDYPEPPSPERTEFEKDITDEILQNEFTRLRKKKAFEQQTDDELHDFAVSEIVRERHLRKLCHDGLMWRFKFDPDKDEITPERQKILDRMNYEVGIIKRMGFVSYYLVVWDFLHYAANIGVPLGPGRGSGAGSLVAYLIGITHIDPLRYNLLFERFLNPERVSPPDFDIDLCERRRHEVIEYVRAKYGEERVVQIGVFGTLKAKQVVKDVARAMGRTFDEGNRFAKLIPADPHMTLDIALNGSEKLKFPPNEELRQKIESEPWCQELWKYAKVLEGLNRNMSIHAAGVIIGDMPVAEVAPISRGAGDEAITQFSSIPCESLGLLKMDFLGLKTLTLIQDALDLIEESTGKKILSNEIPEGDANAYKLLSEGKTVAVFQLESGGMQDLCRKWKPERLEDVIALIAIYRPGPMEFIPDFLGRKAGTIPMDYDVPEMEPLLAETNGIMLYQEQIMQVVQVLA